MADQYLHDLYYSPESPASFGGVNAVYRAVKNEGKFQISRNKIKNWLKQQDTHTLHKPVRHRFKINKVIVGAVDEEWEADLVVSNSLIIHKIKTKKINTETEFGYVMKHLHKIKPTFISISL